MKIAIASDDRINICPHFGRTMGFEIAEIQDGKVTSRDYRKNDFTGHAKGEHDHATEDKHATIVERLQDCCAVIANGMGMRIRVDLEAAGIQAFITDQTVVDKAIEAYVAGELDNHPDRGCVH